ncbi:MAG TPA: hypothetical protein VK821_06650 [Dehalococcoidia bacterium]|nr:hypothetical protein [Dehalococcoidia bacterium]
MDIQRWFAIESPKEMSETFALISAMYHIAEAGGPPSNLSCKMERYLESICDQSEWFASCMYLEQLRQDQFNAVRWTPVL